MKKRRIFMVLLIFVMIACCLPIFAAENRPPVTDPDRWAGKKIAVATGSIYPDLVKDTFSGAECVYYENLSDLCLSAKNGKADAAVLDLPVLKYFQASNPEFVVEMMKDEVDSIAVAAPKNEKGQTLITEFNTWLAQYKADGRLEQLQKKWIDEYQESVDLEDYSDLPAPKGTLTIATDPTNPPLEFIKNGKTIGFEIALMRDFCQASGYGMNLVIADFGGVIAGVSSGKYDCVISCIAVTEERKESLIFSDEYYQSGPAITYVGDSGTGGSFFGTIKTSFIKTFVTEDRWKLFVDGILVTLKITCCSILFGTIAGFLVHYICRKGNKIAKAISAFCRWLFQGMPLVVFLMIVYYIIFGQSSLASDWVAVIAFSLLFACSVQTLLENGERALDSGQNLAASAIGYSPAQTFFMIILPQAARHFMPVYLGDVDSLLKSTAVVGYIAVVDLTKNGDLIRSITYDAFFPLIAVAVLYFILSGILKTIIRLLTKKTDPTRRSEADILKGVTIK